VSLRGRLLATTLLLVAAGLVAASIATHRFLSDFLLDRVDRQLMDARFPAAVELSAPGGLDDGRPARPGFSLPPGTYAAVIDPEGETIAAVTFGFGGETPRFDLPEDLPGSAASPVPPNEASRFLTVRSIGGIVGDYRALASALDDDEGTLVVAIPLFDVAETLDRLVILEVVVGAIVLIGIAVLALRLIRVGLRPLERMGETAGSIAAGDLTRRVEPADERTEVGRLALALNSMLEQIEAAFVERRASEQRLRRFVADASHELRTPLTSIRGYAELFRRGAGSRPQDLARSMEAIEAEAGRMGILIDDLLLLARLDQGRPLEREPVDLVDVATEAVRSARAVEPERPIELQVDGPAFVLGDERRLRQVLDNLLDNVRVHTPPGTPVRVELGSEGDAVGLSVTDEGPGLTPDALDRAFERFYRGDPARSRTTGGAGLGLSIVAAIVEAHDGTVRATTAAGAGARFDVSLPASRGPDVPSAAHSSARDVGQRAQGAGSSS
jgi:two-component system, OmpR family, sensor kinase